MKLKKLLIPAVSLLGALTGGCPVKEPFPETSPQQLRQEFSDPIEWYKFWNTHVTYREDPQEDFWGSLQTTLKTRIADCDDTAIAALAVLSDDGYGNTLIAVAPPLDRIQEGGHMAYILKKNGLYGILDTYGITPPKYESIRNLLENWSYIRSNNLQEGYFKIFTMPDETAIFGEGNLREKIEYDSIPWKTISNPNE